jgi:hypothetical protein
MSSFECLNAREKEKRFFSPRLKGGGLSEGFVRGFKVF